MANDYETFIIRVREQTGMDLSGYKETQMKRRLNSLRENAGCPDFTSFFRKLMNEPKWFDKFLDRLTINVSEFYRNRKRWNIFAEDIAPSLLKKTQTIHIWSAACAAGEEPYTIAIIFAELGALARVRILATDFDENILEKAQQGIYQKRSLTEVPDDVKAKYFRQTSYGYEIDPRLKEAVEFRRHNLLSDPYPRGFDCIVCRNVCIYFTEEAKSKLYENLSRSLKIGSVLFVGSTEQIFHPETFGFQTKDTFFYTKTS